MRIPQVRWFTLTTFVIIVICYSRLPTVRADRLPLKTYSTADALGHNEVNKILRDSRGFLWFCTAGGLSRFDGYTFVNFSVANGLPDPVVNDLVETRTGEYWLATNGGLVRFNPAGTPTNHVVDANDSFAAAAMFTVLTTGEQDRRSSVVNALLEDRDGNLWCGTNKGLYRLEKSGKVLTLRAIDLGIPNQYAEQSLILALVEDRNGSLWAAAPSGLYQRSHNGSTTRFTKKDGLPTDYIQTLFVDDRGRLWAGTRDSGFFQFSAESSKTSPTIIRSYNMSNGLPTGWIYELFETSDRKFWAATNEGLLEFYPDNEDRGLSVRAYTTRNGLTYHEITAFAEDLSGNLWMGTSSAGAIKLVRKGFQTYDEQDGIALVNSIFEDQAGDLCFRGAVLGDNRTSVFEGAQLDLLRSTRDIYYTRFGRFDGEHFSWFKPNAIHEFGWVSEQLTLQTRNGEWWVGTSEGLFHFAAARSFDQLRSARPIKIYTTKDGLATNQVFRLLEDSQGNVWISTISSAINGVSRWNAATQKLEDLANSPGLPSPTNNLARILGEDSDGNIWIGYTRGVARFRQGVFTLFSSSDGLPLGTIVQIYLDHKGRLWLASARSGLIEVQNQNDPQPKFKAFTTAQGLSSNELSVIVDDLSGQLYVGGGLGLDEIDPDSGRVRRFTTADGLASGAFLAAFRDPKGDLWFGTTRGLSRYTPTTDEAGPPPIVISGVQVAGAPEPVSALGEKNLSLPELSWNQNQVQIEFVGLSFAPGEVIRYQYKIEGVDADWSTPTEQRSVNYANLAPRTYRFFVRAVNSSGKASVEQASVSFTIRPPIWTRWWFVILAVALVGVMIYKLFRYRVNRLVEVANIRAHIAADLHDDIGSSLSQIAVLSEVLRKQLGRQEAAVAKNISLINRVSQEALDSISDIVWAINPQQDHLSDLVRKMRRVASEVLPARNIAFKFNAPSEAADLKLGAEIRRQVFLMFKETINNLVRHSQCTRADIELKIEGMWLLLKVVDNGAGFDPDEVSEGNGLVSLRRRASALGGETIVSSTTSQGTMVTIKVPHILRRRYHSRNGTHSRSNH